MVYPVQDILGGCVDGSLRIPTKFTPVHKDECMLSFTTPVSPDGIFINLKTLQAFSKDHVNGDSERTKCEVYYNRKIVRVPTSVEERKAQADAKVEKLAIGVEGGFTGEGLRLFKEEDASCLYFPSTGERHPASAGSAKLQEACAAIDAHSGVFAQTEQAAWEEDLKTTKHADDLPLDPNFRPCPPNPELWACQECGRTANLWMNLSDGFVGCGRKQWGQPETGCEGDKEGAAVRHFDDTGRKYPLAVKLRSLSPAGGDVFSYDEDDLVKNPNLAAHLKRLGINLMSLEKSEASMTELQIDLNKSMEAQLVLNENQTLESIPLPLPGVVGLTNLGNSCYISSLLQALFAYQPLLDGWSDPMLQMMLIHSEKKLASSPVSFDFSKHALFQLAKLARAMRDNLTGQIVETLSAQWIAAGGAADEVPIVFRDVAALKLRMLKGALGKGNAAFCGGQQQDSEEYLQHVCELLENELKAVFGNDDEMINRLSFARVLGFQTAEVFKTPANEVAVVDSTDNVLRLPIPLSEEEEPRAKKRKTEAGEEMVKVPLEACFEAYTVANGGETFRGQANCTRRQTLASFPPLLCVQLKRFYAAADWTAQKLQVQVEVPAALTRTVQGVFTLDTPRKEVDQTAVQQGITIDLRSVLADEAVINKSFTPFPGSGSAAEQEEPETEEVTEASPEALEQLLMMGLEGDDAVRALVHTNNNVEAAVDLLFSGGVNSAMPLRKVVKKGGKKAGGDDLYSTAGWTTEELNALEEGMVMLESMGCDDPVNGRKLLILTKNDANKIINDLFNGTTFPEQLQALEAAKRPAAAAQGGAQNGCVSVSGQKYRLVSAVTHLGSSTDVGHYIAHAKKFINGSDKWVRFNDDKIEVSVDSPVVGMSYLLFFQHAKEE